MSCTCGAAINYGHSRKCRRIQRMRFENPAIAVDRTGHIDFGYFRARNKQGQCTTRARKTWRKKMIRPRHMRFQGVPVIVSDPLLDEECILP